MRVLHVAASLSDQWGGPVTVLRGLIPAMKPLGVQSTLLAATGERVGVGTKVDGVPTTLVRTSALAKVWTAHSAELRSALPELVQNADVVHIHELWHYPHWAAYRFALKYQVPYIVRPCGELDPWRLRQKAWKKLPYLALIQRSALNRAAAIHAITDTEVNEVLNQVPDAKVRVIPNGVDPGAFSDLPDASKYEERYPQLREKRVILFLGRLHKVKGLDLLARAFAAIAARREDVMLIIAGPDEGYGAEVERILAEVGLSQRALFSGLVTGKEKLEALARADVYVLPSYGEGFSTTVLEAMACGLPVVISKQCKFPEVAEAGAGLVVGTEVRAIAQALEQVLDYPEEARSMGRRGKELVKQKYSWDAVAKQMVRLYQDVVLGAQERHRSVLANR